MPLWGKLSVHARRFWRGAAARTLMTKVIDHLINMIIVQCQNTGTHGTTAAKLSRVWQHWYHACLCFDAAAGLLTMLLAGTREIFAIAV